MAKTLLEMTAVTKKRDANDGVGRWCLRYGEGRRSGL